MIAERRLVTATTWHVMDSLIESIARRKQQLDDLRPIAGPALLQLQVGRRAARSAAPS